MAPISRAILSAGASGEPTEVVRERVMKARDRAARRLRETPWRTNAEVPGPVLRSLWQPPPDSLVTLKQDVDRHSTSTRGIDKVLKVAWTIADLGGRDQPSLADVDAARGLRSGMDAAMLARSA
jgi:magnesium chelatase family protein